MTWSRWFGVFVVVVGVCQRPCMGAEPDRVPETPRVIVVDEFWGCEGEHRLSRSEFVLDGDYYVGKGHRLPKSYIDGLRALILSSREDSSGLLAELGVTPERVAQHRKDIYAIVHKQWPELPEEIPTWAEPLFEYDKISKIILHELAGEVPCSTAPIKVSVTLPGEPSVTVSSEADRPWMLPWTITHGDKTWETYSLLVPKALAVLADPTAMNTELLDGTGYCAAEIWHDSNMWEKAIGNSINGAYSRQLAESLEGFEEAKRLFSVKSAQIGWINLAPRSLFIELTASKPMLVDSCWWWNPLDKKNPTLDWADFLKVYEACRAAATPHTWLADWKQAGKKRSVSLHTIGIQGYSSSDFGGAVASAWTDLGLAGEPEFELALYDNGKYCGKLILGREEPRALVMHSKVVAGEHWLDKLEVDAPSYLVVDRNGSHEAGRSSRVYEEAVVGPGVFAAGCVLHANSLESESLRR